MLLYKQQIVKFWSNESTVQGYQPIVLRGPFRKMNERAQSNHPRIPHCPHVADGPGLRYAHSDWFPLPSEMFRPVQKTLGLTTSIFHPSNQPEVMTFERHIIKGKHLILSPLE